MILNVFRTWWLAIKRMLLALCFRTFHPSTGHTRDAPAATAESSSGSPDLLAPGSADSLAAGAEAMGSFDRLPIHVLGIVHGLVIKTGSLRCALALETASKELSTLCRSKISFPDELGLLTSAERLADPTCAAAFWKFVAAHGHRLPYFMTLDGISLGNDDAPLPSLRNQEGPARAGAAAIQSSTVALLEPVAGLTDLASLCSDGLAQTSSADALQRRAARRRLDIGSAVNGFVLMASLAPLASLTGLTRLHVLPPPDVASLEFLTFLACLGANLGSVEVEQLSSRCKEVTTLDPITRLTGLTSLTLSDFRHVQNGLAPLTALQGLRHLSLTRVAMQLSEALDLQPLTRLNSLQSLQILQCTITNQQPIAALGRTLQKLELFGTFSLELTVSKDLSKLTSLSLGDQATSLDSLGPLTSLQELTVSCSDALESLEPVGVLTGLQLLFVRSGEMLSSLTPLSSLGSLEILCLHSLERVSSLEPLAGLTALLVLSLDNCPCISDPTLASLLSALPGLKQQHLHIRGCPLIARSAP
jgi:hypothetical protein